MYGTLHIEVDKDDIIIVNIKETVSTDPAIKCTRKSHASQTKPTPKLPQSKRPVKRKRGRPKKTLIASDEDESNIIYSTIDEGDTTNINEGDTTNIDEAFPNVASQISPEDIQVKVENDEAIEYGGFMFGEIGRQTGTEGGTDEMLGIGLTGSQMNLDTESQLQVH